MRQEPLSTGDGFIYFKKSEIFYISQTPCILTTHTSIKCGADELKSDTTGFLFQQSKLVFI